MEGTVEQVLAGEAIWCVVTGDCVDTMATLPDRCVDHVVTDPPFEAEAHTLQRRVKRGHNPAPGNGDGRVARIDALSFEPLSFEPLSSELRSKCGKEFGRLSGRWCIVFCQVEAAHLWRAELEPTLKYRRTGVWVKPDAMPQLTGDRPGMGHETIVFAHRPGRSRWNGGGRSSVFIHNKNSGGKHLHETQKPVPLMLELVELFTSRCECIFDPFAGSGTTGIAALRSGRRFVGVELNAAMAETARERLRAEDNGSTIHAARAGQTTLFGARP